MFDSTGQSNIAFVLWKKHPSTEYGGWFPFFHLWHTLSNFWSNPAKLGQPTTVTNRSALLFSITGVIIWHLLDSVFVGHNFITTLLVVIYKHNIFTSFYIFRLYIYYTHVTINGFILQMVIKLKSANEYRDRKTVYKYVVSKIIQRLSLLTVTLRIKTWLFLKINWDV